MARLFLALLPDDLVRDQLASWRDAWTWPAKAALVNTARLHITLHFLGEVPLERIPELATRFTPFALRIARAELWPQAIAVLEPEAIPAPLLALHAALARTLGGARLALDERRFRPHVTLARRAHGATAPAKTRHIDWRIERFHLMSSTPGTQGGYTTLRTYTYTGT